MRTESARGRFVVEPTKEVDRNGRTPRWIFRDVRGIDLPVCPKRKYAL